MMKKYSCTVSFLVALSAAGCSNSTGVQEASSEALEVLQNSELKPGYVVPVTKDTAYWQRICEKRSTDKTWKTAVEFCKSKSGRLCNTVLKIDESSDCVLR